MVPQCVKTELKFSTPYSKQACRDPVPYLLQLLHLAHPTIRSHAVPCQMVILKHSLPFSTSEYLLRKLPFFSLSPSPPREIQSSLQHPALTLPTLQSVPEGKLYPPQDWQVLIINHRAPFPLHCQISTQASHTTLLIIGAQPY